MGVQKELWSTVPLLLNIISFIKKEGFKLKLKCTERVCLLNSHRELFPEKRSLVIEGIYHLMLGMWGKREIHLQQEICSCSFANWLFRDMPTCESNNSVFSHLFVSSSSYESTSSEESSGDEKPKVDVEEEDSSEPEVEKVQETPAAGTTDEVQDQEKVQEVSTEEGGAAAEEMAVERGLMDPEYSQEDQDEQ